MNAHRVQILHVADRYGIPAGVPYHLVFHFLPAAQVFFDQDLRDGLEGLSGFGS